MNFRDIDMFFFEASIPVTFAPSLHMGSERRPPPQPTSNKVRPFSIFFCPFKLKWFTIVSFIYWILMGLNLCNGLNFPRGSHHSSDSLENFSISL